MKLWNRLNKTPLCLLVSVCKENKNNFWQGVVDSQNTRFKSTKATYTFIDLLKGVKDVTPNEACDGTHFTVEKRCFQFTNLLLHLDSCWSESLFWLWTQLKILPASFAWSYTNGIRTQTTDSRKQKNLKRYLKIETLHMIWASWSTIKRKPLWIVNDNCYMNVRNVNGHKVH